MARLLHALLLGLIGAGIVHIAILLLIPVFAKLDAWSALEERGDLYAVVRLDGADTNVQAFQSIDPLFDAVACRFDLSQGMVRLAAEGEVPFWSISVYDRIGQNIFSFNDRASPEAALDFVVANPAQMVELRNDLPEAFEHSVFVEADVENGIAVVRAFVPDRSWEPTISDYLKSIDCVRH